MKKYCLVLVLFLVCSCSSKNYNTISTEEEANKINQNKKEHVLKTEDKNQKISDRVYFGFNKDCLSNESKNILDATANWLKENKEAKLLVEGHTDERGTKEYNIGLGQRRAASVKKYLESKGIEESRIKVISYGKEKPEFVGSNEEAWAKNRRAVSIILEK